ncbi:MAG: TetR/AcrR family transcriptional regulator [Leptospiraceae bacterium]|nr:TetR/AcrR family transcriptional regulator [Leptospiraceae bacterium]
MSKKNQSTPRERILETASNLFYSQGFEGTGVNQIIQESNSFKKSFYTYFSDKNELGLEYLAIQEKELIQLILKMINKYETYNEFVKAWVKFHSKKMTSSKYRGCPFALFSNQSIKNKEIFENKIQEIFKNWQSILVDYIDTLKKRNQFSKKIESELVVKKMILYYEGAQQSFFMTKDLSFIKLLEEQLLLLNKR